MSPIRLLVVGDTHGQVTDLIPKIYKAGELKINHVLVVGDFGLWTHFADGHEFLDEVQEAARINNLSVYAIGGNHENWDHWNWFCENMPTHKGFGLVRRRILLAPKVHSWTWAKKTFVGAGGAVSVDRDDRLEKERGFTTEPGAYGRKVRGTGSRTLWWPNEELTDEDVWAVKAIGTADYLFTHDCSNFTHFQHRLKPDAASERHRHRIDTVIKAVQPKMHFHGHMHTQYDWVNTLSHGDSAFLNEPWTGPETRTIGLEAFTDFNSWGVLDVVEGTWQWPADVAKAADRRAQALEDAKSD